MPVERLSEPSIRAIEASMEIRMGDTWMAPYLEYLTNGVLPADRNKARTLQRQAARYILVDSVLYRRGYSMPLLRCITPEKAKELMREVHEGFCGDHVGGQNVTLTIFRWGYFWPTLTKDSISHVQKCDKCQRFATVARAAPVELTMISSPWLFAISGIDLIGALPMGKRGVYTVVGIDYFTKWVKAEPLATIS